MRCTSVEASRGERERWRVRRTATRVLRVHWRDSRCVVRSLSFVQRAKEVVGTSRYIPASNVVADAIARLQYEVVCPIVRLHSTSSSLTQLRVCVRRCRPWRDCAYAFGAIVVEVEEKRAAEQSVDHPSANRSTTHQNTGRIPNSTPPPASSGMRHFIHVLECPNIVPDAIARLRFEIVQPCSKVSYQARLRAHTQKPSFQARLRAHAQSSHPGGDRAPAFEVIVACRKGRE